MSAGASRMRILLLAVLLLLGAAPSAQAVDCSDYPGGVLDGFAGGVPPSQIQIDRNCTIRNFPASNPLNTNFSFLTQPGKRRERWLIVFDNVVHTGQMACNAVAGHKIWFTNGSSTSIQEGCQNLLIPVEKIDKENPAGQTTASIGVPFTYTLTLPVLFDPANGTVINASGSLNDLHGVTLIDDLNATGAQLTYLGHTAYWRDSGNPAPHTFSNVGGVLTFDDFPIVPAGEQIVVELTVVLDDTPANVSGTQFVNTAKWDFGRLIDGVFYEPLPGEWGITEPLTIAGPELEVTKTGPATLGLTINLGEWGEFGIDVRNAGLSEAWNVTILDQLPDGATGGMCDTTPELLSVRVFEADGTTPASDVLVEGTDFTLVFEPVPTCDLTLNMLTEEAVIGPGERLIITYRTKLDADTDDGVQLRNVAGATRWFNGDSSEPNRQTYTRTLTDGSVGEVDHQDAHIVTAALFGYFFEKSVENLTSGANPATTALQGDTLRYTLRLQSTDIPLDDVRFYDDLGALNASAVFIPGTLTLVSVPPGADTSNTNPAGGTNGAGILDVRNLNVPIGSAIEVQFDIVLDPALVDDTVVLNQADLFNTIKIADSDDPNINGQADPSVPGDEDPTRVVIKTLPVGPLTKEITQDTASVGESFRYRITVPETPYPFDLYDVRVTDDLTASAADLRFLGVSKISGSGPWTPVNSGDATGLVIEDTSVGIDIPAGEQIVLEITVVLEDTGTNVSGLTFTNTSGFLFNRVDGDETRQGVGDPGTSPPMTIVGPDVITVEKTGPASLTVGLASVYTLDVHNAGTGPAWNVSLTDLLPDTAEGGTCGASPTQVTAQLFESDGVTAVSAPLAEGADFSVDFRGDPDCTFSLAMLSAAAAIGADQRLLVTYEVRPDPDSEAGAVLTNVAGATAWFSADGSNPATEDDRRSYTRTLTDGTVDELDHQDAHTAAGALPSLVFQKSVINVTSGADPALSAFPSERLRYRLSVQTLDDAPVEDFTIRDELDRLNDPAVFRADTLVLVTVPGGADTSNTDRTGGAKGTGLLEVGSLSLAGPDDIVVVEFEINLAPVIENGTYATNQAQLWIEGAVVTDSDDPREPGDADPTRVFIPSAAEFRVEKVSTDLTNDPNVLLGGETLRYTITVKNVGTDDADDAELRDEIPVNTVYVPGSTTLNGEPVPDGAGGLAPLSGGIPIHAPEDTTPGSMRADASESSSNVATVVFDVVVDADLIDGTVISNQGFVSAVDAGIVDRPSDDPGTSIPDDPTRDVVGNAPLLFVAKDVTIGTDDGTPGLVDPGDVLHYTITLYNDGFAPATGVVLSDAVPTDTTYVPDSLRLDGEPVGALGALVSPLVAGIPVSSADRTPPLPGAGEGVLSPGEFAVVEFDARVNVGVPAGTVIRNQAQTVSDQVPNLLSDGDGNPATGPEPTVIVVGDGQQLAITKQVAVVGGGAALPGSELEYFVRVSNFGAVPAFDVVLTDDLDAGVPGQLVYVGGSALMNGSPAGVAVVGSLITADYSGLNGPLPAGESVVLRFRAVIDPGLAIGTGVTNTGVVQWSTPPETASASVSVAVGGTPGVGVLSGALWHDADFDQTQGIGERVLDGWTIDLYRGGQLRQSIVSDTSGAYRLAGLEPAAAEDGYELRFRAPAAGPTTATLGWADSAFTNGLQTIREIGVPSGSNLQGLNLPIEPNGVVYGSLGRAPISGATLTLLDAGSGAPLPPSCFDDSVQQGQVTRVGGHYRFDLNFSGASCPSGGSYRIAVSVADSDYIDGASEIIPPTSDGSTSPLSVPTCPLSADDAVPATAQRCEAQPSEFAPPPSVAAASAGTRYHLHLLLDASQVPGSSQIFNNHIPVDPVLDGAVAITKTSSSVTVSRGDLVPYQITLSNELGLILADLTLVDRFPAGFRYVKGSARVDGVPIEPTIEGQELRWENLGIGGASRRTVSLLLAVGAGVSEGEYVNRAQAESSLNNGPLSGEAFATVRVAPDPTFDCTDVMGKVFDDANRNGVQDAGERGLPGIRLVTTRGLVASTDAHGRYHITCAATPNEARGSNFMLKLDDRTLPTGFRMSTRPVQLQRATRGKALRLNYGASVHRVVALDMADAVFEPGSTEMRPQWRPRIELLLEELKKAPAILRLSYVADVENERLVDRRLKAVKKQIQKAWKQLDAGYTLTIEPEIFWRRGAPPAQASVRGSGSQ